MTKQNFWTGVRYVVGAIVFALLNAFLSYIMGTGWLTVAGAAALTGGVGYVEAKLTGLGF